MTSHLSRRALAVLCSLPLAATAQPPQPHQPADPSIHTLPDIVVTASRSAELLTEVIGDVTVVGPDELQAAGKDSVAEILSRQPGVQFVNNGGPQTVTGVVLRGASPAHTLVLLDGMRINGSTSGTIGFPAIDPAMIERIEILRGTASSLYGSDAIGGVVNIITKKGTQDRPLSLWANAGYGTYDTSRTSLGLSGAAQGWDYSASVSAANSRGFNGLRRHKADNSPVPAYNADKEGYRSHAISGTLGYRWSEGHRIGLTAYNGYTIGDYDNEFTGNASAGATYRQQAYSLTSSDRITAWWSSDLHLGFTKDGNENRDNPPSMFSSFKRHYSWTNTFKPHTDHQIAILLERQEERVQASTLYDEDSRNTNAAALIYKGRINRIKTQASIRNDHYSGYGDQATGSLGIDLELTDTWQIGVAANTGFHAPTFNDLYYPLDSYGFQGNPNLKPERSRNIEAHVRYQDQYTLASITVYRNRVRDLINGYVCDPAFRCTAQNVNQATLQGLTMTAAHTFGNTTIRGSADFLDPRNDDPLPANAAYFGSKAEGATLPQRARQVFHAGLEHHIQDLRLGAEYQYTGSRYADAANKVRLGGYSLVNLTAAYDFSKSLGVQVRWNNVLDKDYVLIDGYNTPGSNVFVNLSWRM